MVTQPVTQDSKRNLTIDILRGSAVLLMIITHVNAIFLEKSFLGLDQLTFIGATVCFSTFLFCSSTIYGLKLSKGSVSRESTVARVKKIGIVYIILAFFVTIAQSKGLPSFHEIWDILTLQNIPLFIEFLLAFILYDILIYIFQKPISVALKSPGRFILISIIIYALSRILYHVNLGDSYINVLKSLLVGFEDVHTFGLLSYFPIFVVGLVWGNRMVAKEDSSQLAGAIGIILLIILVIAKIFGLGWERWPPSIFFHLYGFTYIFLTYYLAKFISKIGLISSYLVFMSRNTIEFYFLHVVVIFLMSLLILTSKYNGAVVIMINIAVFSICSFLIYFYRQQNRRIVN